LQEFYHHKDGIRYPVAVTTRELHFGLLRIAQQVLAAYEMGAMMKPNW
jgi:hypothetical protein